MYFSGQLNTAIENARRRGREAGAVTQPPIYPPNRRAGGQYTSGSRAARARAHDTRGLHRRSRNHHPTQLPRPPGPVKLAPQRDAGPGQWREEKGRAYTCPFGRAVPDRHGHAWARLSTPCRASTPCRFSCPGTARLSLDGPCRAWARSARQCRAVPVPRTHKSSINSK